MANGAGEVTRTRAPRPLGTRLVLAIVVSVLATVALTVPLAYQAHSARSGDGTTDLPTSSTTTMPEEPATTSSTTESVPARVLPRTLERTDEALTWAADVDDPAPRPLEGATLRGQVVVQYQVLAEAPPTVKAEFWIDRPDDPRPPEHIDDVAPFTLVAPPTAEASTTTAVADPVAFDTTRLPDGTHAVVVQATDVDGNLVRSISRFEIDNG